jgi:uncharacterized membrane protein (DUF2068 family)
MFFSSRPRQCLEKRQLPVLRAVASFELAKGLVVLLAAVGLLSLAHRDIWDVSASLLRLLHIHHTHHYWDVFLKLADRVRDEELWLVATGCVLYSSLRFVEAYGLWRARPWAEWVALVSGAAYLPFEVYELARRVTAVRAAILMVNLAIVIYMLFLRLEAQEERRRAKSATPAD